MRYVTHKVIYRDTSYYVSIILLTEEKAFYELRLTLDLTGVTLTPLKYITKLKKAENFCKSHLSDDLTLSLLLTGLHIKRLGFLP